MFGLVIYVYEWIYLCMLATFHFFAFTAELQALQTFFCKQRRFASKWILQAPFQACFCKRSLQVKLGLASKTHKSKANIYFIRRKLQYLFTQLKTIKEPCVQLSLHTALLWKEVKNLLLSRLYFLCFVCLRFRHRK